MKQNLLWLIPITLLGALVGLYFWPESEKRFPQPPTAQAPAAKPAIRHPIESADAPKNPLPPLAESDGPLSEGLKALLGNELPQFCLPAEYNPPHRGHGGQFAAGSRSAEADAGKAGAGDSNHRKHR